MQAEQTVGQRCRGGAKLLVIACNTATAIGEDVAREVAAEHGVEVVPVVEQNDQIEIADDDLRIDVQTPAEAASRILDRLEELRLISKHLPHG